MAKHLWTPEKAREMGKLGGRPAGVLNKKTIEKIKTQETFVQAVKEKAGLIAENLLLGSCRGDTQASSILLDRAFGKVPQALNVQSVQFSLKELAEYRKNLNKPPEDPPMITQPEEK